jgi:hypothetical protein
LTPQPFSNKLRLIKGIYKNHAFRCFAGLLLVVIFLGAQFHFCADLNTPPSGSHVCPICSAVGSIVPAQPPQLVVVPSTNRIIDVIAFVAVSAELPRTISSRAPPAR